VAVGNHSKQVIAVRLAFLVVDTLNPIDLEDTKMTTYQVRLINKKRAIDITIPVDENTTILDAAEQQDIELPFSCQSGSCSSCVAKVVEGEVDQSEQVFLDEEQMAKGFIVLCVSYPRSDCTIRTHQEPYLV